MAPMTGETTKQQYQAFNSRRYRVEVQTVLWRYFDFEKFCWLIEKASLFHARLDFLGDPYEGSVTIPYAQQRASGKIRGYMRIPAEESKNNRRLMLCSFVTCWHASTHESPAMWKLYAHEQRGVAVVSTFGRLNAAVDTSKYIHPMLGPIEYFDFDNDDMSLPAGLVGRPGFSKRRAFEHEREIRGMVRIEDPSMRWPVDILSEQHIEDLAAQLPAGVQVPVDLCELVSEIVVAPASAPWFNELVQVIAERRGLAHVVRSSRLLEPPVY